uniref:Uncharacterized protein n=1 Tax=Panagrolaimus sp. PS1159 TaxID=55785 RepID=A0AC35FUL1_9BILA
MDYFRVILPPSALRGMQRSFTSSAFLYPHSNLWKKDEYFAVTAEKNYSAHNVKEFFTDINYLTGLEQYNLANPTLILESPGIETHCIYGAKVQTPESFTWKKGYFPDYQPAITFGDGDGTVNIRSLKVCETWKNNNNGFNVSSSQLDGADHMSILRDPRTVNLLREILYGK